jgi:hypothetical protein
VKLLIACGQQGPPGYEINVLTILLGFGGNWFVQLGFQISNWIVKEMHLIKQSR